MARPHCGRSLGRKLGGAAFSVSTIQEFGDLWKISSAAQGLVKQDQRVCDNYDPGKSFDSRDCNFPSGRAHGVGIVGSASTVLAQDPYDYSSRSSFECRSRGKTLRRTFAGVTGFKGLHSSSIESEPSPVAARTCDANLPHLDGLETLQSVESTMRGKCSILPTDDGRLLYSGMTSKELLSTLLNLQLVSFEPVADLSLKVLNSWLMKSPVTSAPILWLVKRTVYSHFCPGENTAEVAVTLNRMRELGLKGILDYSREDAEDNESCNRNYAGFLNMVQPTRCLPQGSVSFACVKISAMCQISLLERVSDLLRYQHKHPEHKLIWRKDTLPVFAPESPTFHTGPEPEPLTPDEEKDWLKAHERVTELCEACVSQEIPVLVDAEYSSIQPAIDYLTYAAAVKFNKGERPIVWGTMQAYLKDAPFRLSVALAEASKRKISLGVKLVRGAYITRENAIASSLGVPSPVHGSIQETHKCYNACAAMMLDRVAAKDCGVMIATHNVDSGKFAAQRAEELGLDKTDPRVQFAQLKGMADSLSLGLVHAGFNVSKYLPFGLVADVIPYLVRRAEENRGLLGNTLGDRQGLRKELWRRLRSEAGLKEFA